MDQIEENIVPDHIDSDTADVDLQPGAVRYILNCQVGSSDNSNMGVVTLKGGNTLVSFDLPLGINLCIGTHEDKVSKTVFFFVYNNLGNHQILRFYINDGSNGFINTIMEWSGFNWKTGDITKRDGLITGIAFVDNMLYWTDNTGPHKLNVKKADLNNKSIIANIYFGTTEDGTFLPGNSFHFFLNTISFLIFNNASLTPTLSDLCQQWANHFNTLGILKDNFVATSFDNFVQIVGKNTTQFTLSATSTNGVCQLIYQNIYDPTTLIDFIDLGKYPPFKPPTFSYKTDSTTNQNLVYNFVGQFRYRYVYDDNEKSVWSPYSKLAAPNDSILNYIEIDFADDRLQGESSCIIKRVELCLRYLNSPVCNFIRALDQSEYVSGKFRFYNDGSYAGIAQSETDDPFHAIPLQSQALEIIKDRLWLGGNTEGYDPVNVNAKVKLGFDATPSSVKWVIKGKIRIQNRQIHQFPQLALPLAGADTNQPIHQFDSTKGPVFGGIGSYGILADLWEPGLASNWDQRIPLGGFVPYLAGTTYYAISTQVGTTYYVQGGFPCPPSGLKNMDMVSSNPIIYDSSQAGNNICQGGASHRTAIRLMMATNPPYSIFSINDVIPGPYKMRLASHFCYDDKTGDLASKGSLYNLNDPSLGWQQTSTNVALIGGENGYELNIILNSDGTSFTVNGITYTTATNGVLDLSLLPSGGETIIDDLTYPVQPAPNTSLAVVGYLVDAIDSTGKGGSTDPKLISESIRMENQNVHIWTEVPIIFDEGQPSVSVHTDHNGYFYWAKADLIFPSSTAYLRVAFCPNGGGLGGTRWLTYTDSIFRSANLNQMINQSLNYNDLKPGFVFEFKQNEYIVANRNPNASAAFSTFVEGLVTDTDGTPLRDILVVIGRNGRQFRTDSTGKYKIRVYVDAFANDDLTTDIIFCFCYFKGNYLNGVIKDNIYISPFTSNMAIPFNILNIFTFTTEQYLVEYTFGNSYLKHGGSYQFALMHFDTLLRTTTPSLDDDLKIKIPFYTEDLNQYDPIAFPVPKTFNYNTPHVSWTISNKPPIWANKAAWLRSKILNYNPGWFQWVADSIKYISRFDNSNTPIATTFGAGDSKFIMISLENFISFNQDQFNVLLSGESDKKYLFGYEFQVGDRLRLIKDNKNNFFTTYFDGPIKEMIGLSVVIESRVDFPKLHAGTMIEIYNPVSNQFPVHYYEIGDFIDITNAGTVNAVYAQTSGHFGSGDTYIYKRNMRVSDIANAGQIYNIPVESQSVSDFYESFASDLGRAWIQDKDLKQQFYVSGFRWSNKYISGTYINGLSAFEGSNNDILPTEYGLIQKFIKSLIGTSSVLLAVQQTQSISIYVEESQIKDLQGARLIAISDGVVGGKALLEGGYGTNYPESIVENEGRVYGYADNKATAWRYSRDGMKPISKEGFRTNDFEILTKLLLSQVNPTYVFGGFDPVNKEEYLVTPVTTVYQQPILGTDPDQLRVVGETMTFNEKRNNWVSNYEYNAEFYSKVGSSVFISFNNGQLWIQDINPICNNFYGVQHSAKIKAVFNISPKSVKVWVVAGHKSSNAWLWSFIETVSNFYSPTGQETNILDSEFINEEGVFWAEMRKDLNTPYISNPIINGNDMRGEVLRVTIENSSTNKEVLYHIFAKVLLSSPTQKS